MEATREAGRTCRWDRATIVALSIGEGGQPTSEVGLVAAAEVTPNVLSSIFAKRKTEDVAGPSGHKKSKAHMSLRAMR